jgi:hypothetical protein
VKLNSQITTGVNKLTIQLTEYINNNIFIGFTDANLESGPFNTRAESYMYNLKNGVLGNDKNNKNLLNLNKFDYITVVLDLDNSTIELYINGKKQTSQEIKMKAGISYSPCVDINSKDTTIAITN